MNRFQYGLGRSAFSRVIFAVAWLLFSLHGFTQNELSKRELDDHRHMMETTDLLEMVRLNFSNPVHWRFYNTQLKRAGITPETNPQFFKVLNAAKLAHNNGGFEVMYAASAAQDTEPVGPIHTITSLSTATGNASRYNSSSLLSVPNSGYMVMTLGLAAIQTGQPIGETQQVQGGGAGHDSVSVAATGNVPNADNDVLATATYAYVDQYNTPFYITQRAVGSEAQATAIICDAPMPGQGQTVTKVCLGRSLGDCTYYPSGGSGTNVIVPSKGRITFGANIVTNQPKSGQISMANAGGSGGGCPIIGNPAFFNAPSTRINGATLTWDFNPSFANQGGCLQANSQAIYTLVVNVMAGTSPAFASITNAPDAQPSANILKIPATYIYWSCLATGTPVRMANGTTRAIETLEPGEKIISGPEHRVEVVDSVLHGRETKPIMRIRTEAGQELVLTEGHPVVTTRGVVLARLLEIGDKVLTERGPARLISISQEYYDGFVWNLNVGAPPEDMNNIGDASTFYAGGILVGDNQMQYHHNRLAQLNPHSVLDALQVAWHEDYLNYLDHKARQEKAAKN